jgi:hypothetical protein
MRMRVRRRGRIATTDLGVGCRRVGGRRVLSVRVSGRSLHFDAQFVHGAVRNRHVAQQFAALGDTVER